MEVTPVADRAIREAIRTITDRTRTLVLAVAMETATIRDQVTTGADRAIREPVDRAMASKINRTSPYRAPFTTITARILAAIRTPAMAIRVALVDRTIHRTTI